MIDPDVLREIQRLMDENQGAARNLRLNEQRIAVLLGIAAPDLPKDTEPAMQNTPPEETLP